MSLKTIFSLVTIAFLGLISFVFWQNWNGLQNVSKLNVAIMSIKDVQNNIQKANIALLHYMLNPQKESQDIFLQEISQAQEKTTLVKTLFSDMELQEKSNVLQQHIQPLLDYFQTYTTVYEAQRKNENLHVKYEQQVLNLLIPASDQLQLQKDYAYIRLIAKIQKDVLYSAYTKNISVLENTHKELKEIIKIYPQRNMLYKPLLDYYRNLEIYKGRLLSLEVLQWNLQSTMTIILDDAEAINTVALEDVAETQKEIQWLSIHTGIGVALFLLCVFIIFMRRINHSLLKVHNFSQKVSLGDFTAKLDVPYLSIEVGQTLTWFNEAFSIASNKIFWFESVLNSIRSAIVVVDKNFQRTFYNTTAAKHMNINQEEGMYKVCQAICPSSMCNSARCPLVRIRDINEKKGFYNKGLSFKISSESSDKKYSITCTNLFYTDKSHAGYILHLRNITQGEKMHKRALAASQAKSNFLATISHEIRTPINAIMGFLQVFDRKNLTEQQADQLTKMHTASTSLLGMFNDILDLSKIESRSLEIEHIPFNLYSIVDSITSIARFAAEEKNLILHSHMDDSIPQQLYGDPKRIQQILFNLMNNAVKFTERGVITIEVSNHNAFMPTAQLEQEQHQKVHVLFSVQDTGIGMDKETQEKIFTSFTQADNFFQRRFSGSGLGLSICKDVLKLMDSTLHVHSIINQGSTFSFTIPFEIPMEKQTTQDPVELKKAYAGKHVLVVEDNLINQEIARALLEAEELKVDMAEHGQEALEMVIQQKYDAIFMDMQMPIMDGIECTKRLRRLALHSKDSIQEDATWLLSVPIIAMTANALSEDKQRCFDAGMNAHIAKPIDIAVLHDHIIKWLT